MALFSRLAPASLPLLPLLLHCRFKLMPPPGSVRPGDLPDPGRPDPLVRPAERANVFGFGRVGWFHTGHWPLATGYERCDSVMALVSFLHTVPSLARRLVWMVLHRSLARLTVAFIEKHYAPSEEPLLAVMCFSTLDGSGPVYHVPVCSEVKTDYRRFQRYR